MISKIAHWSFAVFLLLVGLYLLLLGGGLIYLGGSWYYAIAGLITLAIVVSIIRRKPYAPGVYAVILGGTVIWSLFESGLDFTALLPRLAAWIVVGLWFFTPWYRASIKQIANSSVSPGFLRPLGGVIAIALAILVIASLQKYPHFGTGTVRPLSSDDAPVTDWRQYGNTDGGTRFAAISQINTDTVEGLREVWRYRTGVDDDFKMTPLQVDGRLFVCTARNVVIALDDATGRELWRFDPKAEPAVEHQYARTCRGISYFEASEEYAGACKKRIAMATIDARLMTLDAVTGTPCEDFGESGTVDLRKGLGPHSPSAYYMTSPPLVAGDVLVVGGLVNDNQEMGLPSGVVRAYDAVTGRFAWAWDMGDPEDRAEATDDDPYTPGTPNIWSVMSYDPDLDLIYAPTGNAGPDYFGGERRAFDDEYSSSVVALDAKTGDVSWSFQTVHHDIWDYDVPAQPVLVDVERKGEIVPSITITTKQGEVFLLDRRDGTPVYAVEERAVPQGPADGDYVASTQPFSELPNFHPYMHEKDMWGLTPLDQLLCRVEYRTMRYEGLYTPPKTGLGTLITPNNFGGFNWGSVSVDADNGLLVAAPMKLASRLILVTPEQVAEAGPRAALLLGDGHPAVRMDEDAPVTEVGPPDPGNQYDYRRIKYYGLPIPFMSKFIFPPFGNTQMPCFEPPWSEIAVVDLNTGELLWKRPVGSMKDAGPFGWRSGLPFQVGTAVRAGTLTTRGGLTFMSSTMDRTVRAFNTRTGEVEWANELPGNSQATPMSYVSPKTGQQYVIVTVPNPSWRFPRDPKNGTYTDSRSIRDGKGGYVIAYALPDEAGDD